MSAAFEVNALGELGSQRPDAPAVAVPPEGADLAEERLEERALLRRQPLVEPLNDLVRGRATIDCRLEGKSAAVKEREKVGFLT